MEAVDESPIPRRLGVAIAVTFAILAALPFGIATARHPDRPSAADAAAAAAAAER